MVEGQAIVDTMADVERLASSGVTGVKGSRRSLESRSVYRAGSYINDMEVRVGALP